MNKQKASIGLILVFALSLAYLFQDFIYAYVVYPAALLWHQFSYLSEIFWRNQDHVLVWGLFLFVTAITAIATLIKIPDTDESAPEQKPPSTGSVSEWVQQLDSLSEGAYFRWRFSQRMGDLFTESIAHQQGMTIDQVEDQLAEGQLELPADIQAFLQDVYKAKIHQYYELEQNKNKPYIDPTPLVDYLDKLS